MTSTPPRARTEMSLCPTACRRSPRTGRSDRSARILAALSGVRVHVSRLRVAHIAPDAAALDRSTSGRRQRPPGSSPTRARTSPRRTATARAGWPSRSRRRCRRNSRRAAKPRFTQASPARLMALGGPHAEMPVKMSAAGGCPQRRPRRPGGGPAAAGRAQPADATRSAGKTKLLKYRNFFERFRRAKTRQRGVSRANSAFT